ncbi:MAG: alpha/beta-hydrolase family protein [Candidatus Nanopelagicales bacterium]
MDWTSSLATPGHGVALLVAAESAPGTFAPSLSARTWKDQGLITALSTGTAYLLAIVGHDVLEVIGEAGAPYVPERWGRTAAEREQLAILATELAAVPVAMAVGRILAARPGEALARGLARQSAWRLGVAGLGGGLLAFGQLGAAALDARTGSRVRLARLPVAVPLGLGVALVRQRLRHQESPDSVAGDLTSGSPVLGAAAAVGAVAVLTAVAYGESLTGNALASAASSVLPGSPRVWRLITHAATAGALAFGVSKLWSRTMHKLESGTSEYEGVLDGQAAGRWTTPYVSGDPASLVGWEGLGREGRRHAVSVVRTEPLTDRPTGMPADDLSIPTVMGERAVAEPIQVYVGLDNAPTAAERVELALAELDRTDAWDRSMLVLVSPTGTGYVNYCATALVQYLTLGDVATVTMQYSKRPSPLSLGKVGAAREQNRLLWFRIAERVREMPPERRPKVVLFGESLGAHTSQDVFMHWGTLGPQAVGIDRALWIGTPYASKWKEQVTGEVRSDVDRSLLVVVNDFGQIAELPAQARKELRYVLLSHHNDGVTKFGADLLVRPPAWLGADRPPVEQVPPASPRGIPAAMRWLPLTTFFQSLVDMKNAQIPGKYRAWAHDYRPDLPEFVREVFDLPVTDEVLARVAAALEQRELVRQTIFD